MSLSKQLMNLYDSQVTQTLHTNLWKKFADFVLTELIEYKRDNVLYLFGELNQNLLKTLSVDPYSKDAEFVGGKLLAAIVLVANHKKADFLLKLDFELARPGDRSDSSTFSRPVVKIVEDLLFLQARHRPNSEEYGTPFVCCNGYNLILHELLKESLCVLESLVDCPLHELAIRYMVCESSAGVFF